KSRLIPSRTAREMRRPPSGVLTVDVLSVDCRGLAIPDPPCPALYQLLPASLSKTTRISRESPPSFSAHEPYTASGGTPPVEPFGSQEPEPGTVSSWSLLP